MPITFNCSACGKTLNVADNLAGRTMKCRCGAPVVVPGGPDDDDDDDAADTSPSAVTAAVKTGGLIAGLVLFVIAAVVGVIMAIRIRENPEPARQWLGDAATSFAVASTVAVVIGFAMLTIAYFMMTLLTAGWIARDAHRRDHTGLGWAVFYLAWQFGFGYFSLPMLLVSLLAFPLPMLGWTGLVIYLIGRRPGRLVACRHCSVMRLVYVAKCPHCGHRCP